MLLADLPTPSLVLDRSILRRNIATMARAVGRHGVALRPHMKTAKSIEVARLATAGQMGGITVSTVAEAEYFAAYGMSDMIYAVGITPQKLAEVAKLNAAGANIAVITDDLDMAGLIGASPVPVRGLIEVDSGENRGGVAPNDPVLHALAVRLGTSMAGVLTHGGHSYAGRSATAMATIAEEERASITGAATQLRAAGFSVPIVSMGSTPTALHAQHLDGVTEVRAGVYMFGDLFQMEVGSNTLADIAVTVLTSVIGRRPAEGRLVLDAGGLALSKDRSTEAVPMDFGFGLVLDIAGRPSLGGAVVRQAYQEHGMVDCDPTLPFPQLPVGAKLRVAPNHTCMTAAAHSRYHVVDGGEEVVAIWTRVNGW